MLQGGGEDREEYVTSHPKMTKLKEVVLEHFEKFSTGEFKICLTIGKHYYLGIYSSLF